MLKSKNNWKICFPLVLLFPLLVILIQLLSGCGKGKGVPFDEAPFVPESITDSDPLSMIFNFSGAHTGFGDVTGPLWIMLDLVKRYPTATVAAIVDEYSYNILKQMYQFNKLSDLNQKLGISFISSKQAEKIGSVSYIFELFSGGRDVSVQKNHLFRSSKTALVVSDHMHGCLLDHIDAPQGIRLYFNPPGLGPNRSGVIRNPDDYLFDNKVRMRQVASDQFPDGLIRKLLNREIFPNAKLGFLYGAHNTVYEEYLRRQTEAFLVALKRTRDNEGPLVILTPNRAEVFHSLLPQGFKIWTPAELEHLGELKQELYLVSLNSVTSTQFVSLLAASDLPVIIEGNSAVSTALRLNKPFLMYRSPWNWRQISDLVDIEDRFLRSGNLAEMYFSETQTPDFDSFLRKFPPGIGGNIFYQALNFRIPLFSDKLVYLLELVNHILEIDSKTQNGIMSKDGADTAYWNLSDELSTKFKDRALELSLIVNAKQREKISESLFQKKKRRLEVQGVSTADLERRFITKDRLQ